MTKGADGSGEAPGSAAGGAIDLSALDGVIGYQLRRAQLAVFDDFIRAFAEHHIRPSHYGALTAIERNPGSSQTAIAQSLGIKRSNFVKMVDEFERRGLVARRAVAADRRANALHLTQTGESVVARLQAIHAAHERRIGAVVGSRREQKLFLEQLARLSALRPAAED